MDAQHELHFTYRTPYGPLTICANDRGITAVAFGDSALSSTCHASELTNRAATELLEYFAGKRRTFSVPLAAKGSDFQRAVWDELTRIPYGHTTTAAHLAQALGKPSSHRAVGAALHKSPLAIIIPDHRVVGANGRPLGANTQARLRTALLDLERRFAAQDPQTKGQ